MSFLFFEDVLEELGRKLNYDAIVNYAGNSFASKSWDMIQEAYPIQNFDKKTGTNAIANFFEQAHVYVRKNGDEGNPDVGPT